MNRILITIATIALVILGYAMITQSTEPMSCERIISEGVETGEIRLEWLPMPKGPWEDEWAAQTYAERKALSEELDRDLTNEERFAVFKGVVARYKSPELDAARAAHEPVREAHKQEQIRALIQECEWQRVLESG